MRILGIDPGYGRLGVAALEGDMHRQKVLMYDCVSTKSTDPFIERLRKLQKEIIQICDQYSPDCMAIEKLFFFKNQKTVMGVAEVRGMALAIAGERGIMVREFTPLQVKQSLVGYGRADKQQMQKMIQLTLHLKDAPKIDDAADALAIAWCALNWKQVIHS